MAGLAATHNLNLSSRSYALDPSAPDPVRPRAGALANGPRDNLDDLFNYDAQVGDTFRDAANSNNNATDTDAAIAERRRLARIADGDASDTGARGLGIDEEVKVKKARAPTAKLDETRLLGEKGIPRLRKITKDRLRFKGKGHEFSDVARLLSTYQLWLDDLFPKAKFADGLTIIEKLGHSRRLQVMRKEWIDEGKPKPVDDDLSDDEPVRNAEDGGDIFPADPAPESGDSAGLQRGRRIADDAPVLGDLYAPPSPNFAPSKSVEKANPNAEPEDDELDQLLAEGAAAQEQPRISPPPQNVPLPDDFVDDEDAMAGMEW